MLNSTPIRSVLMTNVETQTDSEQPKPVENRWNGPARPMEKLVQILKSDVRII